MTIWRRRWLWLTGLGLIIGIAGTGVVVAKLFHKAIHHQPSFYTHALSAAPHEQRCAGDQLERNVLDLHNQLRNSGQWSARFTDEQINGWLAWDLPEKFAGLLPPEVVDPRVAIEDGRILVAFRYQSDNFDAVISLTAELFLSDQPNEIGIRFSKIRAGLVPISYRPFLDGIAETITSAGIQFRWGQAQGMPVALVTVPSNHEEYAFRDVQIDLLELRKGEVVITGRSAGTSAHRMASSSAANRALQP